MTPSHPPTIAKTADTPSRDQATARVVTKQYCTRRRSKEIAAPRHSNCRVGRHLDEASCRF